jgi:hypothetical protein
MIAVYHTITLSETSEARTGFGSLWLLLDNRMEGPKALHWLAGICRVRI